MLPTMIRISCLAFFLSLFCGCDVAKSEGQKSEPRNESLASPTASPEFVKSEPLNETTDSLCHRLQEIKKIPYKNPDDTDPILEALIAKGDGAVPCLVKRITDETPMEDPRGAQPWRFYVVGDTAVFILARIEGKKDGNKEGEILREMLPRPYREEWKTNGVYAYFNYVSEPKNRKDLQNWWRARGKSIK